MKLEFSRPIFDDTQISYLMKRGAGILYKICRKSVRLVKIGVVTVCTVRRGVSEFLSTLSLFLGPFWRNTVQGFLIFFSFFVPCVVIQLLQINPTKYTKVLC